VIEWNRVIYADCMNEENGLPTLEDKSIDLCYTDPPWGVSIDKTLQKGRSYCNGRELKATTKDVYKDEFRPEWNLTWFKELERICNSIILVIGENVKYWWIKNTDPIGDITIHWKNGHSATKISKWNKKSTYLVYGKLRNRLYSNIFLNNVMKWGFIPKEPKWKHPSPKGTTIALKLLREIKPESLLDPFSGSGSYLKAADILNIKWFGYEENIIYKEDIDRRFLEHKKEKDILSFAEGDA
jgi:DNA modification methylase